MSEREVAAPAAQGEEGGNKIWGMVKQMVLVFAVTQLATKYLAPKAPAKPDTQVASPGGAPVAQTPGAPTTATLEWGLHQPLDVHVYFSTSPRGSDVLSQKYRGDREPLPHIAWENVTFGDWTDSRTIDLDIRLPEFVTHKNGSLFADVYVLKNHASLDPESDAFNPQNMHHVRKLLTPYYPKHRVRKEKNLLSSADGEEEEEEPEVIVPHWHRNVTLALVSDAPPINIAQLAAPAAQHVAWAPKKDAKGDVSLYYKPIVFFNEFWHLKSHYEEINSTTTVLPLQVTFQPMSYMKFNLFTTMTASFNEAAKQQGGGGAEFDEIKRMLLETNPYFLALTGFVTVLHMLFEFLAFSSDVSHWRNKQEMVGVSVRTIIVNVVTQIIILLYLIDNNEETSWMILFTSGIGILVEAWKITKAVDTVITPAPGKLIPYKVEFKDKHVLSEDEKKTQEYDKLAFRYVSYVAIPLLMGYTVYSLVYGSHRGWYSFIIGTLTSFVYMFGFAQLVPQLIINYKLKSVAHMPIKAMVYKTLSTVVDDFFAFCIKMPILHRLACFRDDVVFLIFLYQRWIYRIDPKRVNEYGQVMAGDVDAVKEKSEDGAPAETKKTR
ncbi:cleft lip and palate transmembrane protein 1-domain-containing protein [Schizophyllum amplum]|uniref:Cleft lip and palate transmembrane protein 1-domain-containing protein n=1 Tax=Schizophyllum amplum TaxID=97359 RepID=A0A550CNQ0_9AGAR|nr:cleft lip and palate transmembrane protein 1-domain-containing protein [Auriculariopsis ampla]